MLGQARRGDLIMKKKKKKKKTTKVFTITYRRLFNKGKAVPL